MLLGTKFDGKIRYRNVIIRKRVFCLRGRIFFVSLQTHIWVSINLQLWVNNVVKKRHGIGGTELYVIHNLKQSLSGSVTTDEDKAKCRAQVKVKDVDTRRAR